MVEIKKTPLHLYHMIHGRPARTTFQTQRRKCDDSDKGNAGKEEEETKLIVCPENAVRVEDKRLWQQQTSRVYNIPRGYGSVA